MNIDDNMNDENGDSIRRMTILAVLFVISFAVTYYFLTKFM